MERADERREEGLNQAKQVLEPQLWSLVCRCGDVGGYELVTPASYCFSMSLGYPSGFNNLSCLQLIHWLEIGSHSLCISITKFVHMLLSSRQALSCYENALLLYYHCTYLSAQCHFLGCLSYSALFL